MDIEIIKNPIHMWSFALVVAILLSIAISVALNFINRFKRKQPFIAVFAKTHTFFIVIVSLYFGTLFLDLPEQAALWRLRLLICAFAIQSGLWGNEVILY